MSTAVSGSGGGAGPGGPRGTEENARGWLEGRDGEGDEVARRERWDLDGLKSDKVDVNTCEFPFLGKPHLALPVRFWHASFVKGKSD